MDFTLPFPFTFFAELITKAVKIKKHKCFLNSNDLEIRISATPALIVTHKNERKTFFPLKNRLTAMII